MVAVFPFPRIALPSVISDNVPTIPIIIFLCDSIFLFLSTCPLILFLIHILVLVKISDQRDIYTLGIKTVSYLYEVDLSMISFHNMGIATKSILMNVLKSSHIRYLTLPVEPYPEPCITSILSPSFILFLCSLTTNNISVTFSILLN